MNQIICKTFKISNQSKKVLQNLLFLYKFFLSRQWSAFYQFLFRICIIYNTNKNNWWINLIHRLDTIYIDGITTVHTDPIRRWMDDDAKRSIPLLNILLLFLLLTILIVVLLLLFLLFLQNDFGFSFDLYFGFFYLFVRGFGTQSRSSSKRSSSIRGAERTVWIPKAKATILTSSKI